MLCPEHALSATRAAIKAQQDISALQLQALGLSGMEFGIGINTGTAIAGNMGDLERLEYSIIGDTVNTAARLTAAAPGGKIWISAETYRLISGQIDAIPLAPLAVKGKTELVQAYEVISVKQSFTEKPLPGFARVS